jgi:hypothetical protein
VRRDAFGGSGIAPPSISRAKGTIHMRNRTTLRRLLATACLAAAGSTTAAADQLLVGSPNTVILSGTPFQSSFDIVGACGGAVASMAVDADTAWIGDESGIIYRRDLATGAINYAFNSPIPALGLALHGGDLLCAGGTSVVRLNKTTGAVLATYTLFAPASCIAVQGDEVFIGSEWGLSMRGDADLKNFQFFGTCGGPVNSIAVDATHMFLGSTDGSLYRVELATQAVLVFTVGGDLASMAVHGEDLLIGDSDARVVRVHRASGALKGSLDGMFPVGALAIVASPEVGTPYCYAGACPCGNDGGDGGCVNSTGFGGRLVGSGSTSVSADDLRIDAFQLPAGRTARFYMAHALVQAPLGDGFLCAGSGGYGLFRFPSHNAGSAGSIALEAGLASFAAGNLPPAGQLLPGANWNFQVWFRDPTGPCGSGLNTTNALSVTFTP